MSDIGRQLKEHWLSKGLKVRAGVPEVDLKAFESRYWISLPADLRAYFSEVNGLDGEDANKIAFWPLLLTPERPHDSFVRNLPSLPGQSQFEGWERIFVFADWLIWSSFYFIKLSSDAQAPTPVFFHARDCQIAKSFSDFAGQYIQRKLPMQEKL